MFFMNYPSVEITLGVLTKAGWFALESRITTPDGWGWQVFVSRGEHDLVGEGARREQAWWEALKRARMLDSLSRFPPP